MAEKTGSSGKVVLLWLLAVGGLGAGGYYGFTTLKSHVTRSHSVIIDLKSETINEIRASGSKTVAEVKKLNSELLSVGNASAPQGSSPKLSADLTELKQGLAAIQTKQQAIITQLGAIKQVPTVASSLKTIERPPPITKIVTKVVRPFRQTIYFPLNKIMTPSVDEQIKTATAALKGKAGSKSCTVDINGFSDTLGGDVSNLKLSQARADYVARKLRYEDFNVTNVQAWGERRLETHTLDGIKNEKNRRVEIDLKCEEAAAEPKPAANPKAPVS